MSNPVREVWMLATLQQRAAMTELDRRGLQFLVHFGTKNAVERLLAMDRAFLNGTLYEWLRDDAGIVTSESGDCHQ